MGKARIFVVLTIGALAACSKGAPTAAPSAEAIARAASLKPADSHLAGLYAASCHACHGTPGTGAPLAGDRTAWAPRWGQGMPTLISHVVGGYRGMPAGGQCFACTQGDYQALITFMAGRDMAGG